MPKQIQLPSSWSDNLLQYPETGMGYQLVKLILKDGTTLTGRKVINAAILLLEEEDEFELKDIDQMIPELK